MHICSAHFCIGQLTGGGRGGRTVQREHKRTITLFFLHRAAIFDSLINLIFQILITWVWSWSDSPTHILNWHTFTPFPSSFHLDLADVNKDENCLWFYWQIYSLSLRDLNKCLFFNSPSNDIRAFKTSGMKLPFLSWALDKTLEHRVIPILEHFKLCKNDEYVIVKCIRFHYDLKLKMKKLRVAW